MLSSGGVCAVLNYELDQMTEYIADMAQRITQPNSSVSPAFRKFVSGLLSSTRLPDTTILLGMNLLARRTNQLNHAGPVKFSDGTVWRMLTIALLLGSKFLDDNTFQNRSWSEVSGIPVRELNTLEIEWLKSMGWNLYVNLDESTDYNAWLDNWSQWRIAKNIERKATLDRLAPLAPINTNVARPNPYAQSQAEYQKPATNIRPPPGFTQPTYNASWNPYATPPHLTPPSAPDSAVHTPEYLSATGGAPGQQYTDWAVYNQQHPAAFYTNAEKEERALRAAYFPIRVANPQHQYGNQSYNTPPSYNSYEKHQNSCPCTACGAGLIHEALVHGYSSFANPHNQWGFSGSMGVQVS